MSVVIAAKSLTVTYAMSSYNYTSFKELLLTGWRRRAEKQVIRAVDDATFQIRRGESVALLGHNGSGKSTLLKAIAGVIRVPQSMLVAHGRIAPMIELGAGFDAELSGRENIVLSCMLLGMSRAEVLAKMDSIISFSELHDFIDMPVKNYSTGMYARLGFACATAVDPEILLVDEVLAVGDSNFAAKCLTRINELVDFGTTIVLVSHDMTTVRRFCRRGIVLQHGVMRFDGAIDDAVRAHEAIMVEERDSVLSEEEKREHLRLAKLKASNEEQAVGRGDPVPRVKLAFALRQDGEATELVDLGRPFELDVTLGIQGGEHFHEDISVGLGIHLPGSVRIGGCNNFQRDIALPRAAFAKDGDVVVRFSFRQGLPQLCARDYELVVGVHDEAISRNVATRSVGTFKAVNSALGPNADGDITAIHTNAIDMAVIEGTGP